MRRGFFFIHTMVTTTMTDNIKLSFGGDVKDVPLKSVVTTRLLETTKVHMAKLKERGMNQALTNVLVGNPVALRMISGSGMLNSKWMQSKCDAIQEEHKAVTGQEMEITEVRTLAQKRCQDELFDAFPEVLHAIQNPSTVLDLENVEQMNSCVEIVKLLIDDSQLNALEKQAMVEDDFWLDQDLQEVTQAVARFRERLQR